MLNHEFFKNSPWEKEVFAYLASVFLFGRCAVFCVWDGSLGKFGQLVSDKGGRLSYPEIGLLIKRIERVKF